MNKLAKILTTALIAIICLCGVNTVSYAKTLDEIHEYDIEAIVNNDATVTLYYHIEWEVLDSSSEGPLSWVKVGIPNKNYQSFAPLSDTIDDMSYMSSGGSYLRIDLDRKYYEGETVSFDFNVVQDELYDMNVHEDGYTEYTFTPGWFDDIEVDNLRIKWYQDKAESWSPSAYVEDEYITWEETLDKGEKFTVKVTYPNDAFNFNEYSSTSDSYDEDSVLSGSRGVLFVIGSLFSVLISIITSLAFPAVLIFIIIRVVSKTYQSGANFGGGTEKKITRTKIEYYPVCQGCGGTRAEGQKFCGYCGRSFVKSEETVTEENISPNEKDILNFKNAGEFKYSSSPNTYIRVNVLNIPVKPVARSIFGSSGGFSSGSHHSCVHSSCACACACACAGGGRAGCTTKDFYNTDLKLKYLKPGTKNQK